MYAVVQALIEYLADFGLPVHLADTVPQGLAFPYLTAAVSMPCAPGSKGCITMTLWCAGGIANTSRLMLHDTLMQYFPHRGLPLETQGGLAVIRPGMTECVQQGAALGVRTTLDVRFFPHEQGG